MLLPGIAGTRLAGVRVAALDETRKLRVAGVSPVAA
jgi:hypothetical protein